MRLLYGYLRGYWKLVLLALFLATVNQVFSLLDPLIFRHVIDQYATRYRDYTHAEFLRGVSLLLAAAVGVAFVSRVAKNFQDYFVNVITQRLGARLYSDGSLDPTFIATGSGIYDTVWSVAIQSMVPSLSPSLMAATSSASRSGGFILALVL